MSQNDIGDILNGIEIILIRQLAVTLTTALMIFGPDGTLIFYNEPAEPILGQRFEETGRILVSELPEMYAPTDEQGLPLPLEAMPSHIALVERRPAYNNFWIRGLDGVRRHLEVSAFPLIGQGDRLLGSISVFWEKGEEQIAAAWTARRAPELAAPIAAALEGR
jgi:PAS domain-containing protein